MLAASGEHRDGHHVGEGRDGVLDPGPRLGQPQAPPSGAPGEAGRDVQEPVPQRFGFARPQPFGQGQEPQPGGQVSGDRHDGQPRLIDAVFARKMMQPAARCAASRLAYMMTIRKRGTAGQLMIRRATEVGAVPTATRTESTNTADDVADAITWMVTRPSHVNVDELVLKPRAQAAQHKVHRV